MDGVYIRVRDVNWIYIWGGKGYMSCECWMIVLSYISIDEWIFPCFSKIS